MFERIHLVCDSVRKLFIFCRHGRVQRIQTRLNLTHVHKMDLTDVVGRQ